MVVALELFFHTMAVAAVTNAMAASAARDRRMRAWACLVGTSLVGAQWLPDVRSQPFESHMAPTYEGERCAFYDVHRMRPSSAPRLGELSPRPASLPNLTICDGYGVKRKYVRVRLRLSL